MTFARRVFLASGVYGVALLVPMLFLEARIAETFPPAHNHPELYYGFIAVTLAWQLQYLLIGTDPVRFRPPMLVAALAKTGFATSQAAVVLAGRAPATAFFAATPDLALAALFVVAWWRTPTASAAPA